jgi:enamine deaminase RidA (YjgF/YER057c/UK114 family)
VSGATAPRVLTGNPGEERFGYSQALTAGDEVVVAGQVGRDNVSGAMIGPTTIATRCATSILNVRELAGPGAALVSVQVHATPAMAELAAFAAVLGPLLAPDAPALTVVPVHALTDPSYLVEISAIASNGSTTAVPDPGPIGQAFGTSRAVRAGDRIHVAGQLPLDDRGAVLSGGTAAEHLDAALAGVAAAVEAAGATMADVVSDHVFISRTLAPDDFAAMSAVHAKWFAASKPTATLLFVPELPFGALAMVSAVAAL